MRKLFALIILQGILFNVSAQDSRDKVIEKRAREMHRVIGLSDKAQWKKFVIENYSQALIDKPMKAVVNTSEQGTAEPSAEIKSADNLEAKVAMYKQLHEDFGNSKIISIKPKDVSLEMVVENNSGLKGTFFLTFDKKTPYLIDGISIEAGEVNR